MSEGSNLPREPVLRRTWLHSEPAARTIRRLQEQPDYLRQITNAAKREINPSVRRVLTYSNESDSEPDAHVLTKREFPFGEIDTSIIPLVRPRETTENIRIGRHQRLQSESGEDFSLITYTSSIFDSETNQENRMADEHAAAPLNVTSDGADFEISRLRDTSAGMPETVDNPRPGPSRAQPDPERYLRESNKLMAHLDDLRETISHNQTRYTHPIRADREPLLGNSRIEGREPDTSVINVILNQLKDLSEQVHALQLGQERFVNQSREKTDANWELYRQEEPRNTNVRYTNVPEDSLELNSFITDTNRKRIKEARDLIPIFDGSSEENLKEFLHACSYAYGLVHPAEEMALTKAITCTKLKGQAMTEMENRNITTYRQLKDTLEACYSRKKSATRLQREFNFLRQKPGEEARIFGKRVDKLATELYESATDGMTYTAIEKRTIQDYIKSQALINFQLGLNEKLQTIVRARAPTTLADAIAGAMEEEKVKGLINSQNFRDTGMIYNRSATYTRGRDDAREGTKAPTCLRCGKIGHLGRNCRTNRYGTRYELPRTSEHSRINATEKYCTYCQKVGHTRNECWKLHGKPAEQLNSRRREDHRNTGTDATERRNRKEIRNNYERRTERGNQAAQEFQVHQVRKNNHAQTGLDLVILPVREARKGKIPLLLDTGSSISFIKVRNLKGETPITIDEVTLTGITGHQAITIGRFTAMISMGERILKHRMYVVKDDFPIEYEGILGVDFLQAHNTTCCYRSRKLKIFDRNLTLLPYKSYYIPARSEMIIPATTNVNSIGIVTAEEKKPGVFIGNCLVTPDNYSCAVSIINTTEHAVKIATPYVTIEDVPHDKEGKINHVTRKEHSKIPQPRAERLKQQLRLEHLNNEERKTIYALCENYSDIFFLEGDQLTHTTAVEHRISTRSDSAPVNVKPYRLPEKHKQEVDRQVKEMLENGIVRHSISQWNAPLLVVPKKTDATGKTKLRVVIDFRKLNDLTIGDCFPLPNISDILDQLGNAKYFTTLDLASGYHQIPMAQEDKAKTAFSTPTGHFEFNRMPFGLKNAPATFQRLMNTVLAGLQGIKCLVYLDDIVIYGSSLEDHNKKLISVLSKLRHSNLKLQPDKCEFLRKEVVYLGHIISEKGILPDPSKLKAVNKFPVPRKVKDVQSFIGLAGYYRRFIEDFSKVARPLTKLTKKEAQFEWGQEQEHAFATLKQKLTTAPVLKYPDFSEEFIVTTDASDYAIGAILSQGQIGKDNPIAYASRILSRAEQNYSTTEKELLAIVWAVKHFRPYVYGTKFKIVTDHKPLIWLFNVTDPGSRLIRWRLKLEEYDYEIIHKAGRANVNADALSRNVTRPVLKINATTEEQDNEEEMNDAADNEEDSRKYTDEEKRQIIYEYHDAPLGGHQGVQRTLNRIRLNHRWKNMIADIKQYISKCELCQKNKLSRRTKMPLVITDTPRKPFEKCALDIVGPLPITNNGNKYILTFQDNLTKFSKAMPIANQEAPTIAKEFVEKIILEYGIPEKILTDQGTNFLSNVFKNTCKLLKIEKIQTTAYHPQSNGALERSHRTLAEYLKHYINTEQSDWDEWMPYATFTYNTTPHTSTNFTPFELIYGHEATLPSALQTRPTPMYTFDDYAQELKQRLRTANQLAREYVKEEKIKSKRYYDQKTKGVQFQVGDKVLLYDEAVRRGRSKKLDALWVGPYEIIKKQSDVNYIIKRGRKTLTTHANRLKLYIED